MDDLFKTSSNQFFEELADWNRFLQDLNQCDLQRHNALKGK